MTVLRVLAASGCVLTGCVLVTDLGGLSEPAVVSPDGAAPPDGRDPQTPDGGTNAPGEVYVFVLGGESTGDALPTGFTARVGDDGILGPWTETPIMPQGRLRGALATTSTSLVYVGGLQPNGLYTDRALVAKLDRGVIVSWSESAADPTLTRFRNAAFGYGDRVHVLGGWTPPSGEVVATTARSSTSPEQGLGRWTAEAPLPWPSSAFSACVIGPYAYAATGRAEDAGGTGWVGALGASGSVTEWRPLPPLPNGRITGQAAATASATHLYMSGGYTNGSYDWVSVARARADGSLEPWIDTSRPAIGRVGHTMAVAKDHLYLIGGEDGSGAVLESVEVAAIRSDGTLEPFAAARPLPSARRFHATAVVGR